MRGTSSGLARAWRLVALLAAVGTTVPLSAQQADAVNPVDLPVGRSLPISGTVAVTRVSIANPEVADVVVVSEREVVINSIKPGETDAIVWFADGTRTHYRISVHSPADRKQIAIAIKFAEVRRDLLQQLGVSGLWRDANTRVGSGVLNSDTPINATTGALSIPSSSNYVTVLSNFGTDQVLGFIQTEETKGNARLLAEPNLLAGNKDTASFLAGGELPIPIVQTGAGGGTNSGISIQFREFGIRLRFQGEILNDSLIKLNLTPEVSSLDYGNAILLQGFRIPAFRTRRISTTVDVRKNQSLIISGLMSGEEEKVKTGLPYLKDIPILGLLFSSTRFQRNETELLVVVTPVVVDPNNLRSVDTLRLLPDTATRALDALRPRVPTPVKRPQ